ncbi:MAG: YdeI/OmpD-associated family protein [Saprospiraceae bacterium]|nr:YdeI/OmpD-associated family protein [Saprospiraceae bacterium]
MEDVTFHTILNQFENSSLWGWHFLVPNEVAVLFVNGKDRRVVVTINNKTTLHCALMPNKDTWFIMLNQGMQKQIGVPSGGDLSVVITKDNSRYGMPMPDEFREVLDQDPQADYYFHTLTPGKQRSLIYIISKVKNTDSRIKKALAISDHLVANKGVIDYKLLNEALKAYNKM